MSAPSMRGERGDVVPLATAMGCNFTTQNRPLHLPQLLMAWTNYTHSSACCPSFVVCKLCPRLAFLAEARPRVIVNETRLEIDFVTLTIDFATGPFLEFLSCVRYPCLRRCESVDRLLSI